MPVAFESLVSRECRDDFAFFAQCQHGSGIARALMESTLGVVAAQFPGRPVRISAQSYLLEFYASLGFRRIGEPYLEDGIEHVAMVLDARAAD